MNKICIKNYVVDSPLDKRIVVLSDIHYYNKNMVILLEQLEDKVKSLNPDYICMPGDFIDERVIHDQEIFFSFLRDLASICPIILSLGNHEAKSKLDDKDMFDHAFLSEIRKLDQVYLLDNRSWINDGIRFTGLTLPLHSYKEKIDSHDVTLKTIRKFYPEGLKRDKFNIVLSHSPYSLLHPMIKKEKFYQSTDLILSGHTHGGLTPTFLCDLTKRTFVTPMRHLFPKNSYGYLKKEKTIVSSGITKLSHFNFLRRFNFLFCGEIVLITLKKGS